MMHEVPEGMVIDHVNRNRRDCRRENLRLLTRRQNAQNRTYVKACKSGFVGVYFDTPNAKWQSRFGKIPISRRETANEAAEDYDKYIIKFINFDGRLNFEYTLEQKETIKLSDWSPKISQRTIKHELLPRGVYKKTRSDGIVEYQGVIGTEYIGYSLNKDDIIAKVAQRRKEIDVQKNIQHYSKLITRDENGTAIIRLGGKSSRVALVDDSMWHELTLHGWHEANTGYPSSRFDGRLWTMHEYLTRLFVRDFSHKVIDHIDRDKMNNTMNNLRLTDRGTNSKNSTYVSTMQKVDQFDKNGKFIKTWDDIRQVRDDLNLCGTQSVTKCCMGLMKTAGGFQWKYHTDDVSKGVILSPKCVKVDQLNINGEFVRTFDSVTLAAFSVGKKGTSNIIACIKGRQKTCKGFKWKYHT
jgi:hypothetical protein